MPKVSQSDKTPTSINLEKIATELDKTKKEISNLKQKDEYQKAKKVAGRLLIGLAALIGILEFGAFQYYPRSQEAFYRGKLRQSRFFLQPRAYINMKQEDWVGIYIGIYQGLKLRILGE